MYPELEAGGWLVPPLPCVKSAGGWDGAGLGTQRQPSCASPGASWCHTHQPQMCEFSGHAVLDFGAWEGPHPCVSRHHTQDSLGQ